MGDFKILNWYMVKPIISDFKTDWLPTASLWGRWWVMLRGNFNVTSHEGGQEETETPTPVHPRVQGGGFPLWDNASKWGSRSFWTSVLEHPTPKAKIMGMRVAIICVFDGITITDFWLTHDFAIITSTRAATAAPVLAVRLQCALKKAVCRRKGP